MNKSFLTEVFGEQEGFVYEYIGTVPDHMDPESIEMVEHVTQDFLAGHGDNLLATRVVQFPYENHRIMLYAKSDTDINTSTEFILRAHLVPDVVVEQVVETVAIPSVEETTTETTTETTDTTETTSTEPSSSEPTQGQ
jgi:hypothetical protein